MSLAELRIKTSKVTDTISDILSTRRIARSDASNMETWDEQTFKQVYQDKVVGSASHLQQVEDTIQRWDRKNWKHLAHDLNEIKEDYFEVERDKLLDAIAEKESLWGFINNYSAEGTTFEQKFNHLYNSLADYAERTQGRYDRAVEREKAARKEFRSLRDKVETLDPNFDWKSLEGHPTWLKNKWLTQATEDIPSMLYDIEQMKKKTNYAPNNLSVRKQYSILSNMVERDEARRSLGQELMGLSFEDFNKRMTSAPDIKELKRAIYSVDGNFYTEEGNWFRSGIDQKEYERLFPPETFTGGKVITNPLVELKNKTGAEFNQGFGALSAYERSEFASLNGQPKNFQHGDKTIWYREGDDLSWLSPEERNSLNRSSPDQTIKNLREMYGEENKVKRFRSVAEEGQAILDNLDILDAEAAAKENGTTVEEELAKIKGHDSRVDTKQGNMTDQVRNDEKIELETVRERGADKIERRSVDRLLLADTARNYTFGYRQKALLGFMGTTGAMTLLEATMNSPSTEVLERRRQLEEERRRKKLGY